MINILNKKIFVIFIILLLVALTGSILWFVYQQKRTKNQLPTQIIKEQKINTHKRFKNEQPTTSSLPGFKTYRNEEWGFQFEYPRGFIIEENYFSGYYSKFNLYILDKINDGVELAFLVNIVLSEFAERSFSGLDKKTKEIIVDGVPGVEYEYKINERREKIAIFPFGDYKLILGIHYKEYENLYEQVLSTFKFLK